MKGGFTLNYQHHRRAGDNARQRKGPEKECEDSGGWETSTSRLGPGLACPAWCVFVNTRTSKEPMQIHELDAFFTVGNECGYTTMAFS